MSDQIMRRAMIGLSGVAVRTAYVGVVGKLMRDMDALEARRLLSASAGNLPSVAAPLQAPRIILPYKIVSSGSGVHNAVDQIIPPNHYAAAYGLNDVMFGSTVGSGAGETIAIIDSYDDPELADTGTSAFASSDLAAFDSLYGFASPPEFVKLNESGGTTLPTGSGGTAQSDSVETALDVEYAHAMAPQASIILIECNTFTDPDLTYGVNTARQIPGVIAVSMSWGSGEYSSETGSSSANGGTLDDGLFQTPVGHTPITFTAGSGDSGYGNLYPSASPYVLSAGGTDLVESGGNWGSETGWAYSGGGPSPYEPIPSYQNGVDPGASTTNRMTPDLSMDAGRAVDIYDTDGYGGTMSVEGTSIVAPSEAGLMAIVDQGRALEGLPSLNGYAQTLPRLYGLYNNKSAYAADFHDVTTGSSGSSSLADAGVGYDLVTGVGTPIGAKLVPDLAGGATVSGTVYNDQNSNGNLDAGEPGISGVQVYIDVNNTGSYVAGDPTATTNANGTYSIQDDVPGYTNLIVREVAPSGYTEDGVANPSFTTSYNGQYTANFGNVTQFPATITGSSNMYVRLDPTGTTVQVYYGTNSSGTLAYSVSKATLGNTAETFQTTAGSGDTLTIDYSNGDPMNTSGQYTFSPAGGSSNAHLIVEGTPASATMSVSSSGVVVNSQTIPTAASVTSVTLDAAGSNSSMSVNFTGNPFSSVTLNGLSSSDSISLTGTNTGATTVAYAFGGSSESLSINTANPYTITGDASMGAIGGVALTDSSSVTLVGNQTLSSLVINNGGGVLLARSSPSTPSVITATSLTIGATAYLDLDDNAMAINYSSSPINTIDGYLATGYAGGAWNGYGIRSTSAANDFTDSTAIGAVNNQGLALLGDTTYSTFMGVPVSANSVLMRYTYYGDTDLNGVVDGNDFANFIAGINGTIGGWVGGDFDYNGTIDANDFSLFIVGMNSPVDGQSNSDRPW